MDKERIMGLDTDNSALCNSREKYWRELGIEEKLERMRQIIHQRDRQIMDLEERLAHLGSEFPEHKHVDGQVVTPVRNRNVPTGYYGSTARLGATLKDSEDFYF